MALESIWNQAEEKGDVGALDLILNDALVYIDEDGALLTKSQFLARVKHAGVLVQSITTQAVSVHVFGGIAVVGGRYRAKGVEKGKAYQREGRFIDVWVIERGNWICVAAESTPILR